MIKDIGKIFIGILALFFLIAVLTMFFEASSDVASKTIPEDSEWADNQKQIENTTKSIFDILLSDPTDLIVIAGIIFAAFAGGYLYFKH